MDKPLDILLIESLATNAYTVRAMLAESSGLFRDQWVTTIDEAITLLKESSVDAVLSNLVLGDAGGLDVVQQLRIHAEQAPLLIITATDNSVLGREVLAAGAQDYLVREQLSPLSLRKGILYAIERSLLLQRVKSLAVRDDLTQLFNRRGFNNLAEQQLRISKRMERPCAVLFIDLDNLKKINDTLGHKYGDMAIAETADILREVFRTSDIIARIGGDEFVILAPDTIGIDQAVRRLEERLQARNTDDAEFALSASTGVAYSGEKEEDLEELIHRACTLMYEHKKGKKKNGESCYKGEGHGEADPAH
jgi:diguanylate cyclase (GGDEF)-like protein